jgi:ribonuclease P protein component
VETGFLFPRRERLKGRDNIREVFRKKKAFSCPGARLLMSGNGLKHNRVAFSFPRKYGNAVERNHSRRLSREAYRLLRSELRQGYDLILLVYSGRDNFPERMEQLRALFLKAGLLNITPDSQK